jgi:hypothetical protein
MIDLLGSRGTRSTHQPYQTWLVATALTLGIAACETRPEPQPPEPPAFPARAETRQDTVYIEGMPEVSTARLLHATELDPPFSTYVPAGIAAAAEAAGDSGAVRFSAAFTGEADPNAYMHVRLYPVGTNLLSAREVVAGFLRSRQPQDDPVAGTDVDAAQRLDPPAWGLEAHRFDYAGEGGRHYVGRITLAQHGPRFFHVLVHYPAEYGDGLSPRLDYILEHWRWEDTGEPLRR